MAQSNNYGPRRYDRNVRIALARKQLQQTFTQGDLYDILDALTRYPGVTRVDASKLPDSSRAYVGGLRQALSGLVQMSSLLKGLITDAYLKERISMDRMLNECLTHNDLSWTRVDLAAWDRATAADKEQCTSVLVGFAENARGSRFSVVADPKVFPSMVGWDIDINVNSDEEMTRRKLRNNQRATFRGRKLMSYEAINNYEENPGKFIYDYRLIRTGRVAEEFAHHLLGALRGNELSTQAFSRRFIEYARDIDGLFASRALADNVEQVASSISEAMSAFRAVKDVGMGMEHSQVVKTVRNAVKPTEIQTPVAHEVPEAATAKPLPVDTVFGPGDQGVVEVVCDVIRAAKKIPGPQKVIVHGREFEVVGHALDDFEQVIAFQIWSKDLNMVQLTWEPSEDARENAKAAWSGLTSEEGFFDMLVGMAAGVHDFGADEFPLGLEVRYQVFGETPVQRVWLHVDGERVHMSSRDMDTLPATAHAQGDNLLEAVHDVATVGDDIFVLVEESESEQVFEEVDNRA